MKAIGLGLMAVCVAALAVGGSRPAQDEPALPPRPGGGGAPPPPPPPPSGRGVPADFVEALVRRARADVGRVKETSPNRGPEIDQALAYVDQGPGQNWCAAILSTWIRDAATECGIAPPAKSAGARNLVELLRRAGVVDVIPRDQLPAGYIAPRGAIGLWDRSKVPGGWEAHVGVSEGQHDGGPTWRSLEGNGPPNGDRVDATLRSVEDPRLLAVAVWRVEVA